MCIDRVVQHVADALGRGHGGVGLAVSVFYIRGIRTCVIYWFFYKIIWKEQI